MRQLYIDPSLLDECGLPFGVKPLQPFPPKYVETISFDKYPPLGFIGCKNGVGKHTDGKELHPYTALLVIRNDGFIAKPSRIGKEKLSPQWRGTLLVLNIHKCHHVIPDPRIPKDEEGLWIALCYDYEKKPDIREVANFFVQTLTPNKKFYYL